MKESLSITQTLYLDGYQYVNGNLEFFPVAGAYVKKTENIGATKRWYDYVFNYTDHLGNIRLSYTLDYNTNKLKTLEENHYYPFGLKHRKYNNLLSDIKFKPNISNRGLTPILKDKTYKYKYNGKELQDELGLNVYDYGARNYDASLGRWMNVDPLAEQFPNWSPYNYTLNNPVRFIDPDGRAAMPADWPPKWWTSNVNKWNRLNNKEKNIIRWDPQFYKAFDVETNADVATTMTKSTFGRNGKGDKSDAFRHAYWQALNTQDVGESFTEKWSDAHEYSTPTNEVTTDLYMDIHNNNVGIEVGKNNPDATPDELKTIILDRIKKGDLLIINSNNKLIKSDGGIIKNNSEIRRYDTSKKIGTEILKDPKGQKTKDYE